MQSPTLITAIAPEGRVATPATVSEGGVALPALRSKTSVSGGRATPVIDASGPGSIKSVGSGVSSGSGVGHGSSDEAILLSLLGGREAARLERTAKGPTGIVEGRTRRDVRRLEALNGVALVDQGSEMEAVFKDNVFLVVHDSYVDTV